MVLIDDIITANRQSMMPITIANYLFVIYLALSLRILLEQMCFGYLLYKKRALFLLPFLCTCAINLLRWPYIAARYPRLFAAEFILGRKLKVSTTQSNAGEI